MNIHRHARPFEAVYDTDDNGNPAGGRTTGMAFHIVWQNGPVDEEHGRNGAFVEEVVAAVINRIQFYQDSKFVCRENALVITKLEEAIHWMNHRTAERMRRGVEGTYEV